MGRKRGEGENRSEYCIHKTTVKIQIGISDKYEKLNRRYCLEYMNQPQLVLVLAELVLVLAIQLVSAETLGIVYNVI